MQVPAGTSICEALLEHGIAIEHACEQVGACTTCHCIVRQGFGSLNEVQEQEEDMLDRAWGLQPQSRLSCQAIVGREDLTVELPATRSITPRRASDPCGDAGTVFVAPADCNPSALPADCSGLSSVAGWIARLAQRGDDLLLGGAGLHLHPTGQWVRGHPGIRIDGLDGLGHGTGAAAAGHVFKKKLHGKLLGG